MGPIRGTLVNKENSVIILLYVQSDESLTCTATESSQPDGMCDQNIKPLSRWLHVAEKSLVKLA